MTLDDVTFAYDGPPVLSGLDLSIAASEHVAITGASGSGKSSLLALLLRLAEPQAGDDDGRRRRPECDAAGRCARAYAALLSQDSALFNDTISANLLIGRSDATDDRVAGGA